MKPLLIVSICVTAIIGQNHAVAQVVDARTIEVNPKTSTVTALISGSGNVSSEQNSGLSVTPDLFTGTAMMVVPFEVPYGRNGLMPKVELRYRASNGNGWTGVGWELELGAIRRSSRFGVDYIADQYVLQFSGADVSLVPIGQSEYKAQVENGFFRIRKVASSGNEFSWELTDKTGSRYYFGTRSASRQDDPSKPGRVYKWCLDRIEDTRGNFILFSYAKDEGQIYLDQIDYVGHQTVTPIHQVKFFRRNRDDISDSYGPNFRVRTRFLLNTVALYSNHRLVRAYELTYEPSKSSLRSRLTKVVQFGNDAKIGGDGEVTNGSALPATTLSHTESFIDSYSVRPPFTLPLGIDTHAGAWVLGDWNGDSRTDLCLVGASRFIDALVSGPEEGAFRPVPTELPGSEDPAAGRWLSGDWDDDGRTDLIHIDGTRFVRVFMSMGNGLFTAKPLFSPSITYDTSEGNFNWQVGEWNGDGRADLLHVINANEVRAWFSRGDGTFNVIRVKPTASLDPSIGKWLAGDWNGDGRIDFVDITGSNYVRPWISRGDSHFDVKSVAPSANGTTPIAYDSSTGRWLAVDCNGDGKTDLIHIPGGDSIILWFSHGDGNFSVSSFKIRSGYDTGRGLWWPADVNNDGRSDLVHIDGSNQLTTLVSRDEAPTTGEKHFKFTSTPVPAGFDQRPQFWVMGDWNGDGKTDLFNALGAHHVRALFAGGTHLAPDLLKSVSNGTGGLTIVEYLPSSIFPNKKLPFVLPLVSAVSTFDGRTIEDGKPVYSTVGYEYVGGYFNSPDREFRGFNYVKITGPSGHQEERLVTEIWFHQGNDIAVDKNDPADRVGYMKGKPYRSRTSDAVGQKYSETTTEYKSDTSDSRFNPPEQVDTLICDGDDCGLHLRTRYNYDSFGNVVREEQFGDVNDASDDRTTVREFALNVDSWIVGLRKLEILYEGIGNIKKVAATDFYYDGTDTCTTPATNQVPSIGNLTRIKRWNRGRPSPETRMAYDGFGNLQCNSSGDGHKVFIAYDTNGQYATSITNALKHTTLTSYYGVDSVELTGGLYGQVKAITDPNGSATTMTYDAFGRKARVQSANGNWTTYTYMALGDPHKQHIRTDFAVGLSTWEYFDGLGRSTRSLKTGPNARLVAIDRYFDKRGQIWKVSSPYFEGDPKPVFSYRYYDVLGRLILTEHADGSRKESCYNDGVTVMIDENGHRVRQTRNSFGEIVRVEEYRGTYLPPCTTSVKAPHLTGVGSSSDSQMPYATTVYKYDASGNLVNIKDAQENSTRIRYDNLGRRIALLDPNVGTQFFSYDANGNLLRQLDAKGQAIYYRYDELNRLIQKNYGSKKPIGNGDVEYVYDRPTNFGIGRVKSIQSKNIFKEYFYDEVGRVIRVNRTINGTEYPITNRFDNMGRPLAVTYPNGDVINYAYTGPVLERVYDQNTTYATYENHNAFLNPQRVRFGNGTMTSLTYANSNNPECPMDNFRLCSIQVTGPANQQYDREIFKYDKVGNLTTIEDGDRKQLFVYDEMNRLIAAGVGGLNASIAIDVSAGQRPGPATWGSIVSNSTNVPLIEGYAYDAINNLVWNSHLGTYRYPTSGPSSVRPQTAISVGTESYAYDRNGNLTSGGGRQFVYDFENQVTAVVNDGVTTQFEYDEGTRTRKIVNSEPTTYVSDLYECNSVGCTKYIWAGAYRLAKQSLPDRRTYFFHANHQGSVKVVTDDSGQSVQFLSYSPFGKTNGNGQQDQTSHQFNGHEFDRSSGLYYYGARYYDAALGRFISPDSIVSAKFAPQYLNRYSYGLNNPVSVMDADGHNPFLVILGAAAVGAAIGGTVAWIRGDNILQGMAMGAIAGAFTAGVGTALIGPGTQWALKSAIYAVGGAGGGATNAALFEGDIGQGALFGAAFAIAGYGASNFNFSVFGDTHLGTQLNRMVNASVRGAVVGGAYAAATGKNVFDGMVTGAKEGIVGETANNLIGHIYGGLILKGERKFAEVEVNGRKYKSYFYDVKGVHRPITFGNVVIGGFDDLSAEVSRLEVFMGPDAPVEKSIILSVHEVGHTDQGLAYGHTYLLGHAGSMLMGGVWGMINGTGFMDGTHRFGYLENYGHPAPDY